MTFSQTVLQYFADHARDLPWRRPEADGSFDPYKILVSEIMLQQTQVARVIPKYQQFLAVYPTIQRLAQAPLSDVLRYWSGLGYNRRAKYVHGAAKALQHETQHWTYDLLIAQPGIGPNTAKAVLAYSYNQPVVFIETNIRTVLLHHFFQGQAEVSDQELLSILESHLPSSQYREWYWALMDYGAYLKRTAGSQLHKSRTFVKQSVFAGSRRQLRGQVLKLLTARTISLQTMKSLLPDERLAEVLQDLIREGLITYQEQSYQLAS